MLCKKTMVQVRKIWERINIYTMDEIKEGMETYTAPPTDYPGAEEDALEMDCEPG